MKRKTHKYANGGQVTDHLASRPKGYADGGSVTKKRKPMKPPEKGDKPRRITASGPAGGPHTPGAKGTYPKGKKMADGGQVKKKVSKKKGRRPSPETLGSGMAAEASRRILSARERREREAGL